MQQLATLFVSLVTIVNTLSPKADLPKVLGIALKPSNAAFLSLTDEKESGESASVKSTENVEAARQKRLSQLKSLQEKVKESSSEGKVNREEYKRKLASIKNAKKQQIVTRIDENIIKLNQKWVDQWTKVLDRLALVLAKIETRSTALAAEGKDVTALTEAIEEAHTAIEDAQTKIAEQAVKTYVVSITDESSLGSNVKTTINTFHNDIKNTKESIQLAKKAVVKALTLLKGQSETKESKQNEQ